MTATNGNPLTDEPMTAEACLDEAIANLRQAEQAWPDSRVSDAAVRNVVEIARGWVMAAAETRAQYPSRWVSGTQRISEMRTDPYADKPMAIRWAGASAVDEQSRAAFNTHTFRSLGGPCRDCSATPEEALAGLSCTRESKAHEHGPNCRHAWVHATAPCYNGCDAMPEDYYIGKSPSAVCPKSSCPDVNA